MFGAFAFCSCVFAYGSVINAEAEAEAEGEEDAECCCADAEGSSCVIVADELEAVACGDAVFFGERAEAVVESGNNDVAEYG